MEQSKKDLRKAFEEQYHYVIENGKPSGRGQRYACMKLIEICILIDPDTNYGNPRYGAMNVQNINKLAKRLGIS